MSPPLVTVVIATKNAAAYLSEALDSVAAQTYQHYEIVIVDGQSTDATGQIARTYAKVRFTTETGSGFASAWNDGIARAQGALIALLDSDDRWPAAAMEKRVDYLVAHPEAEGVVGRVKFFLAPGARPPRAFRAGLLEGDHLAYMPGALLARRSLFEKVGGFSSEWAMASDIDWFARLKDSGCSLGTIPDVVIHKRMHDSNLSLGRISADVLNPELLRLLRNSIHRQRNP